MQAHVVEIKTDVEPELGATVHRWHCSCGYVGDWKVGEGAARRARNGGARHVAAMERGR